MISAIGSKHKTLNDPLSFPQVRADYLKSVAETIDIETAFQFGVLEMKRFFNNMPQAALDKKSNFEFIE